jgi:predicted flap endonuclease-1-like 5' DNA nuclease
VQVANRHAPLHLDDPAASCAPAGPLYFGFSDVHVQRALAASYTPAELAYALYGTYLTAAAAAPATQQQPGSTPATAGAVNPSVGPSSSGTCATTQQQQEPAPTDAEQQQPAQGLSAAEAFATELQGISGIGAATAQVLALTKALGGVRHGSLRELCRWLSADTQHAAQLRYFLLNR